jgi:hypothetical protein
MISEAFCKILVLFGLVQNLEILVLTMPNDEKVNIAVTNFKKGTFHFFFEQFFWPESGDIFE